MNGGVQRAVPPGDHDGGEAFRGCIHGGRQSGRPGAHDHQIVDTIGVDRLGQAQIVGQGRRRRIAQDPLIRRDHHRQLVGRQLEAAQEAVGARVEVGVEQSVRIAVADQESLEAECIGAVAASDQDDPTVDVADQPDPAQDERPHDDLADIRLARDQAAKVSALDAHDPTVGAGAGRNEDLAIVELVQLAGELPGGVNREHIGMAGVIEVEDLDRAVEHQEEVDAALAAREQQGILGQPFLDAVGRETGGHLLAQPRESLRLSRVGIGRIGFQPGRDGIAWHSDRDRGRSEALQLLATFVPTALSYGLSSFLRVAISCLWGSVSGSSGVTNG